MTAVEIQMEVVYKGDSATLWPLLRGIRDNLENGVSVDLEPNSIKVVRLRKL